MDLDRKNKYLSHFPQEEYESRCKKLAGLLAGGNIGLCILSGKENISYFSGYDFGEFQMDDKYFNCFLVITGGTDPGPVLIVGEGNEGTASISWVKDRRFFKYNKRQFMGSQYEELLNEVILEKNGNNEDIGIENGPGMRSDHNLYSFLCKNFPGRRLKDCSRMIWSIRKIKSAAETSLIRKSCEITCRGYIKGFNSLKEGMLEKDVSSIMGAKMLEEGADCYGSWIIMLYSGKTREKWCDAFPSDYMLKKGDLVQVDGGCSYKGYKSDILRMACIGQPSREQEYNFNIAMEAHRRSVDIIKEGIRCKDIWMKAEEVWSEYGLTSFIEGRRKDNWCTNGHGIGLDIHEPPAISLAEDEELKSGMVITIEVFNTHNGTWPLKDSKWWYLVENMILVKKDGCEVLSCTMADDLWIA